MNNATTTDGGGSVSDDQWTAPGAEPTEQDLRRMLDKRTSAMSALASGTRLAASTAATGLPVALLYALVSGLVGYAVLQLAIQLKDTPTPMIDLGGQITLFAGGLCALYAMIQFAKRETVSRASWWPALFAVPLLLASGGLHLIESGQSRELGPIVLQLFVMSWSILWMSFGGAATAIAWIVAGRFAMNGHRISVGDLASEVAHRTLDVAAPHGARVHAVTIGMQMLLPGIFYAVSYAFVDMIAVLDPSKQSLRRSSALAFGIRGKLFRLMLVWWLLGMVVSMAIALPLEGAFTVEDAIAKTQELLLDLSAASQATFILQEVLWSVWGWVLTLAVLVLYVEREDQVSARNALKKLKGG